MDRQNHLISLVAVFLSLGIGILFGASMGVNALVLNQITVIEQLRDDIRYSQDEKHEYALEIGRLRKEIDEWAALEKDYLNPVFIKDKLADYTVGVLCQGDLPDKLKEFLELGGCHYRVFLFKEGIKRDELCPALGKPKEDPGLLVADLVTGKLQVPDIEKNILSVYEKNPSPSPKGDPGSSFHRDQRETAPKEIFFAVGMLDPPLLEAVAELSFRQKNIFSVSFDSQQGDQIRLDSLPSRIKLLQSIQDSSA
ncbi:MAG TPA: copper transporter [Firmicutes bacterium]|jgi:hypothetical protein|nr:copper transporter [Bacillota bacterium]